MPVKKLSIKKGKKGKLKIFKEPPTETEEDESMVKLSIPKSELLDDDEPPFEPDEEKAKIEKPKIKFGASKGKVGKPIQGTVAVKEKDEPEKVAQMDVEGAESVQPAGKPMANVGYGIDRTVNLGDFESLKIHVTLHVPSEVDVDEINDNYLFCKGWVEKQMEEVISEYTEEVSKKSDD